MVRPKKRTGSRSKPSSSAPPSSTVDQTSSLTPPPSADITAGQCAVAEFRQGNHAKAQKMIKELLSKHKNSAIVHQCSAAIQLELASLEKDPNSELKHLYDSAKSAQQATILSPNTISLSLLYVYLLYTISQRNKEYDKVIQECDRALSIDNPLHYVLDVEIEDINEGKDLDLSIDQRIEKDRNKITKLKEMMNVVKILDVDGEVGLKFKPDGEEQSKREGEIKELIKKKEKDIKEIKKRIEKVKRKLDFDLGFDSKSSRVSEIEKLAGLEKITENVKKTEPMRKYWNEMSVEMKKRLLQVRIEELIAQFDKNNVEREALMEAIDYAREKRTWKFWQCYCGEKFVDGEVGKKHFEEKHEKILPEKLQSVVPSEVDHEWVDMIENGDWRPVDTEKIIRTEMKVDKEWPLSDDTERAKILKRIRCMLQLFLRHKCLAESLLGRVIEYAREKLLAQNQPPLSQFCELNKTLQCLRLLGLPELNNALKILQEVCNYCDLTRLMQNEVSDNQEPDIRERVVFSSDFECLLLDERLLQEEFINNMYENAVADDGSAITSAVDDLKDDVLPIGHGIINWLYCLPIEEQVASWTQRRGDKLVGLEIFEILDTEFSIFKIICQRKCEFSTSKKAVWAVNCIVLEENNRRKQFPETESESYASLLRERRKELVKRDGDALFRSSQLQLDAIQDVLEEALTQSFNQFTYEECIKGDDQFIQEAIQRMNTYLYDEHAKIDAVIMREVAGRQQLKLKLRGVCAYDYRSIMLPLMKLFMQARLEDLVDKDALEKSEAAQKALLAELALDPKKNISKGSDHDKQMQQESKNQKSKNKKKKRDRIKPKGFKGTGGNEDLLLHQEDAEKVDVSVPSLRADELEEQKEEQRHKIELEERASKHLAEFLEYQKQFENEAKEKCLSQQKTEGVTDKQLKSEVSGVSSSYYEKSQQDRLEDETGIPKVSSSFPESIVKGTMKKSSSVSGTQWRPKRSLPHVKFVQGPPNQGKPEGALPSDQRKECQSSDSGALLTEKEMHEGGSLQTEGLTGVKILDQDNVQRSSIPFKEQEDFPLKAEQKLPEKTSLEGEEFGPLTNEVGTSLEFNCFLNVIIQSLWNLRRFRDEFMAAAESMHEHFGNPCVACELFKIFSHLSISATEMQKKSVDPTSLKTGLSDLIPHRSIFEEGQMNDASEVLGIIFTSLHESFVEIKGRNFASQACISRSCFVHKLFGMTIIGKMNCVNCGLARRRLKYTTCVHKIDASELKRMKCMHVDRSFDELLKLLVMNHELDCDSEEGGCGNPHHIHYNLFTPPHFFTTVLGWQTNYESEDDISATLRALTIEIDLGLIYPNLVPGIKYCIGSVVCYDQLHYICFAYSHEHKTWIMYDDETVKVIGCWGDVLTKCTEWRYQPHVLFFEAVSQF